MLNLKVVEVTLWMCREGRKSDFHLLVMNIPDLECLGTYKVASKIDVGPSLNASSPIPCGVKPNLNSLN